MFNAFKWAVYTALLLSFANWFIWKHVIYDGHFPHEYRPPAIVGLAQARRMCDVHDRPDGKSVDFVGQYETLYVVQDGEPWMKIHHERKNVWLSRDCIY